MYEYTIRQIRKLILNLDACEVHAKAELEEAITLLQKEGEK